jgi:Leucine-rich repeat (LRR) protein
MKEPLFTDQQRPEIGVRTWRGYAKELLIGAGGVLSIVLVIALAWRFYDSSAKASRDRRFYTDLNSILTQIREQREAPSPDFAEIRERAQRTGISIANTLKNEASPDVPARQLLLWAARDEIPRMLYGNLAVVSQSEIALNNRLTEAAELLKMPPPSQPTESPAALAALAEIERLGGVVTRDTSQPNQPVIFISMKGDQFLDKHLEHLPNIATLEIESSEVTDDGLRNLSRIRSLSACSLRCSKITDAGIGNLAVLPGLDEIRLYDCSEVTDRGVLELKRVSRLTLLGAHITDRTLAVLVDLPNLQQLVLRSDSLTDEGLSQLASLPHLTTLSLSHCHHLTDAGLAEIAAIQNLETLSITGTDITDAGLKSLENLPRLGRLAISRCESSMPDGLRITDEGLTCLKNFKVLHAFSIEASPDVTDESVDLLKGMTGLKSLQLKGTGVTEKGHLEIATALPGTQVDFASIPSIRRKKRLAPEIAAAVQTIRDRGGKVSLLDGEVWMIHLNENGATDFTDKDLALLQPIKKVSLLSLEGTSISDVGLAMLSESISMEQLVLKNCQVTAEGIRTLAKLPELTSLQLSDIPLDEAALLSVSSLPLETLAIANCGLQDPGLQFIAGLPDLSHLTLREPLITAAGWGHLGSALNLRTMLIADTSLPEEAMQRIAEVPNLITVSFQNCEMADGSFVELATMTRLRHLSITGNSLTDSALRQIKTLPQLSHLIISSDEITDAGLAEVAECRSLSVVALTNSPVTDQGLKNLSPLGNLSMLTLVGTLVTDDGVAEFKKLHPDVFVSKAAVYKSGESK